MTEYGDHLQNDEEFSIIRSPSLHRRLLQSQWESRCPEFHLGVSSSRDSTLKENEKEEMEGSNHGHYANCSNLLSARHGGDGAGGHVDHARCGIAPYRI